MICQLAFSRDAFERLIAYRLMNEFRPLTSPVPGPGGDPSWLDGVTVDGVHFQKLTSDRWVALNEQDASGRVAPSPMNEGFNAAAIRIGVHITIHFATVDAVSTAGTSAPPTTPQTVPAAALGVIARVDVDARGVAWLRIVPDLMGAPPSMPPNVPAALTMNAPLDIAAALADLVPTGTRVLNAGLNITNDDEILLRFEMSDEGRKALIERYQGWYSFFEGAPPSHLAHQAWAICFDGSVLASAIATQIDPQLTDRHPLYFSPGIGAEFRGGAPPRITVSKYARIDNACVGNDVRLDVYAHVDFSVPRDNVLRGQLQVDFEKNAGDVAKCFGLSILNPLGILITAFDQGSAGLGVAFTAADLLIPGLKPIALLAGLGLLIAGVDHQLAQNVIDEKLEGDERVTRTSDGFALDRDLQFTNDLTQDWFVLTEAATTGGLFVMRGRSDVPAPSLPRVEAHSLTGFSPWALRDRCEPGRGQETIGTLALTIAVGYRGLGGPPSSRRPTIALRYGLRPDNGNQVYEVVGDGLGVYQDAYSEYRQVDIPGVPGTVTVKLTGGTVQRPQFVGFAEHPYDLRLRMFTNGGVREYTFAAPPKLTAYTETIAQAAARISRCKQLSVGVVEKAILEVFWSVDPPDLRTFNHQWKIHAAGLSPGQRARVWSGDGKMLLADGVANVNGRVDLRAITPDTIKSIRIATDPVRQDEQPASEDGLINVSVQQTLLTEIDRIQLPALLESFLLEEQEGRLILQMRAGRRLSRQIDLVPTRGMQITKGLELGRVHSPVTRASVRSQPGAGSAGPREVVSASGVVAVAANDGRSVSAFRKERSAIVTARWRQQGSRS